MCRVEDETGSLVEFMTTTAATTNINVNLKMDAVGGKNLHVKNVGGFCCVYSLISGDKSSYTGCKFPSDHSDFSASNIYQLLCSFTWSLHLPCAVHLISSVHAIRWSKSEWSDDVCKLLPENLISKVVFF